MPLKPVAKKEFTAGKPTGSAVHIKSPRIKVRSLGDDEQRHIKMMMYGGQGTGKTYILCALLELGYKIVVLSTDFGGDGLTTVILEMKRRGKSNLLDNARVVGADGYLAVRQFIDHPEKYIDGLWDSFVPHIFFWDGFSGFQQLDIAEHIEDSGKGSDSDLKFETAQWGMVRNATIRTVDDFLDIVGPSGVAPHKIVTCLEKIILKEGRVEDQLSPLLQGAGGILMGAAFDLIWRSSCEIKGTGDNVVAEYRYQTQPDGTKRTGKSRGFDVAPVVKAEMYHVWVGLLKELGAPIPEGYVEPKKEKTNES